MRPTMVDKSTYNRIRRMGFQEGVAEARREKAAEIRAKLHTMFKPSYADALAKQLSLASDGEPP